MSEAYEIGRERGISAGSWVIDGNTTTASAIRILEGYEDGDPEVMDLCPSPLSGEWAGESVSELSNQLGIDLEDDEIATDFEQGFAEGFWDEVCQLARAMLPDSSK